LAQLAFEAPVDRRCRAGGPLKGIPTTTSDPQEWNDGTLHRWSYLVLQGVMADDGMLMFLRHVKECPPSSNVYDSLGEAHMRALKKISRHEELRRVSRSPKQERKRNSLQQFWKPAKS